MVGCPEAKLIHTLFPMVEAMREQPWSEVEELLDEFQQVLESLNRGWELPWDDE